MYNINIVIKQILKNAGLINIKKIKTSFEGYSFFYKSDNLKIKGFVLLPKKLKKKNPVIFFNRGGTGEFSKLDESMLNRYDFLAAEGYIVFATQYRGVDGGEGVDRMGGDDVFDIINLFEIVKKVSFVDQNRVGMYGVSRGGMMALQVISRTNWVKSLVLIAPMLDEFTMATWRKGWREHQIDTYGGSEIEMYKRSPLKWINLIPKSLPILLCHGTKDDKVPFISSKSFAQKIKKYQKNFIFKEVEGEGHFISQETKDDVKKRFKETL